MATQGETPIDFGATGTDHASVAVTGQAGILAASDVDAYWMATSTSDNDEVAHRLAASLVQLVVGDIIAGTGFTIYGICSDACVTKTFKVQWVWA